MNEKIKWVGTLSTTERNNIGLIKVRQNNVNSEVLGFNIVDGNGEPYDLKNRKVLFCTYFDKFAPVEQYAEVIENGKIIYTMNEHDMQKPVRINFAYFKIMDDKDNLVDTTQNFSYDIMPSVESKCMNSEPYIIRLEEVLDAFLQINTDAKKELEQIIIDFNEQVVEQQQSFEIWFESIKEILESVDPGGILLSEIVESRTDIKGVVHESLSSRLNKTDIENESNFSKINNTVFVANFPRLNGEVDDTNRLNRAINSKNMAYVIFESNVEYTISGKIILTKQNVLEGSNCALILTHTSDYALYINANNTVVKNFNIRKLEGVKSNGVYVTGNAHTIENIRTRNYVWDNFIHCENMKESHLSNLRIDNDTEGLTGNAIKLDHCLNNTISNSYIGYAENGINCSDKKSPDDKYWNEGLILSEVIIVLTKTALKLERITLATVSNCIFDFCKEYGVLALAGQALHISDTWIQLVKGGKTCISGNADISGTTFSNVNIHNNILYGINGDDSLLAISFKGSDTNINITNNHIIDLKGGHVLTQFAVLSGNIVTSGLKINHPPQTENIKTFWSSNTALRGFTLPNSTIEMIATEIGTDNYSYCVGSIGTDGVARLKQISNKVLNLVPPTSTAGTVSLNGLENYSQVNIVCKSYPYFHLKDYNLH